MGALPTLGFNDTHLPPGTISCLYTFVSCIWIHPVKGLFVCSEELVSRSPVWGALLSVSFFFIIFILNIFFLRIFTGKHYLGAGGIQDQAFEGRAASVEARRQETTRKWGHFCFSNGRFNSTSLIPSPATPRYDIRASWPGRKREGL